MARPWRDVISEWSWRRAVEGRCDRSMATVGNVAKLRGVFDGKCSDPKAFLEHIGEQLHRYHVIGKDSFRTIDERINMLEKLSKLAIQYLHNFKIDINKAALRNESNQKHKYQNRYLSGSPMEESVDRNVLTLARRSLRKASYLKELKRYYSKGGPGYALRDPRELINYVKKPQVKTAEFVGLTPGVRMEQLDFAHRGDFEVDDGLTCGAAFQQWIKDPRRGSTPFFLWLEKHPVCLEDDKSKVDTHSVAYVHSDLRQTADPRNKLCLIIVNNPLYSIDLSLPGMMAAVADTSSYIAEGGKDPRGGGSHGVGVAAFVWSESGEVFIANHLAQDFHHSSFMSGQQVRCAGMIVIEQGIVTALSNNSGHYKPRKEHVLNFVRLLQGKGVLDANAALRVHTGAPQNWTGNPADFHRDYATI